MKGSGLNQRLVAALSHPIHILPVNCGLGAPRCIEATLARHPLITGLFLACYPTVDLHPGNRVHGLKDGYTKYRYCFRGKFFDNISNQNDEMLVMISRNEVFMADLLPPIIVILRFIVRATTKVISRPRFRGYTWRDGDSNLGTPGCRSPALPLSYIPAPPSYYRWRFLALLLGHRLSSKWQGIRKHKIKILLAR